MQFLQSLEQKRRTGQRRAGLPEARDQRTRLWIGIGLPFLAKFVAFLVRQLINSIAKILLVAMFAGSVLVAGGLALFALSDDYHIFDAFEVVGVHSARDGKSHAVSYNFEHADSSNRVLAIWMLPDARPIGSTQRVPRRSSPVIVSNDPAHLKSLQWAAGRLTIVIPDTIEVRNNAHDCYFEYGNLPVVCVTLQFVDVVEKKISMTPEHS